MTGELPYEQFVGLWLNIPRVRYQSASMVLVGGVAASNNEPLDSIWADGLAMFKSQIEGVMYDINEQRAIAKAFSKVGPM